MLFSVQGFRGKFGFRWKDLGAIFSLLEFSVCCQFIQVINLNVVAIFQDFQVLMILTEALERVHFSHIVVLLHLVHADLPHCP